MEADILAELDGFIAHDVAVGFRSRVEIIESAVAALSEDYDQAFLEAHASRIFDEEIAEHHAFQEGWPEVTDCDRLDAAFADLEAAGILARQNSCCCHTCASADIRQEIKEFESKGTRIRGYTFYHQQDTELAIDGLGIHLSYGSVREGEDSHLAIGREVVEALQRQGLRTTWDGTLARRITVDFCWRRRR